MNPFRPTGPLLSFTGGSSAPTSVQAISTDNIVNQQVVLTNTDTTNDCVVGWGASDAVAKLNAAAGSTVNNCYYLLARSKVVINAPSGSYFSGIAVASTAVIKVQAGYGA